MRGDGMISVKSPFVQQMLVAMTLFAAIGDPFFGALVFWRFSRNEFERCVH